MYNPQLMTCIDPKDYLRDYSAHFDFFKLSFLFHVIKKLSATRVFHYHDKVFVQKESMVQFDYVFVVEHFEGF